MYLKKIMNLPLYTQVAVVIVLAFVAGSYWQQETMVFGVRIYAICDFIGTLFLNALKMLILPLVVSSIINGMANIGSGWQLRQLGWKTLFFYVLTTFCAVIVGFLVITIFVPGVHHGASLVQATQSADSLRGSLTTIQAHHVVDLVGIFYNLVPENLIKAAAQGQMIGLILFSLLFGYFINGLGDMEKRVLRSFWRGVFESIMAITSLIMKFAPIGVFALVTMAVMSFGYKMFMPILSFFLCVVAALAIHVFITLFVMLKTIGKVNPLRVLKELVPALLTGFSTSSSAATLPVTMECVERRIGLSSHTTSFVLPLGTAISLNGTALYECMAVLFIAQAYGIDLSVTSMILVIIMSQLTSMGVAGIPSASLVAITLIISMIGAPKDAIAILLVTERFLDMIRTSVNIFGVSTSAILVARLNGEQTRIDDAAGV